MSYMKTHIGCNKQENHVAKNIQAIRGMNDYLPKDTALWQCMEVILKQVLHCYGYNEIRLPIVEQTSLFKRAIGEVTDVVEKEMYTFDDRNSDSLTLRPEGTAGCVRAMIEHGLLYNQEQRLWYMGPMFRYERPQKGRYRQFYQLGVEAFGLYGPNIDAELILLTARFWKALGITAYVKLELNSIGSLAGRASYRSALVDFLEKNVNLLDKDCKNRLYSNPMRILDSKNPEMQSLLNTAPRLSQYLDGSSIDHFNWLCEILVQAGISYTINERLVRGLDYYNCTVFEWVSSHLGAQCAVCGGGRYDSLAEKLGGRPAPAVGFSIGLERLVLLIQNLNPHFVTEGTIDIYVIFYGPDTQCAAILLSELVRDSLPQLKLMINFGGGSFKKQMIRAHKLESRLVLILGENEVISKQVIVKNMRTGEQETLVQSAVVARLAMLLSQ